MADLLWPGDDRADDIFSASAFLGSMIEVEQAWLDAMITSGVAPSTATVDIASQLHPGDLATITAAAEDSGNPASPLVTLLRERLEQHDFEPARWLHRGLTSQDVVDTALILQLRDATRRLRVDVLAQAASLSRLAQEHRHTPMVARTLTQPAVPTTFGLKAAVWLTGLLDALERSDRLTFPAQLGGAAGTRAASVELAVDLPNPVEVATTVTDATATALGLAPADPWHTVRSPFLDAADALVRHTGAWGHIANDVLLLGRPEVGGVQEASSGSSSTMPQKANPVAAVLVRRTALSAPHLLATLHVAAASEVDERPDGGWHMEWDAIRTLARRTFVAGSQTRQLLEGLMVHPDRLSAGLTEGMPGVLAEQESMARLTGHAASDSYFGTTDRLIDNALDRARRLAHLEEGA